MVSRLVDVQGRLQEREQAPFSTEETLVDALQWRALHQPSQVACQFLPADLEDVASVDSAQWIGLNYADLDGQARAIARQLTGYLQHHADPRPRILLAYSPGLALIAALFGCWYAGAIAVPVQPARRHQGGARWRHILRDAQPAGLLTSQDLLPEVEQLLAQQHSNQGHDLFCWATDGLPRESESILGAGAVPPLDPSALALLQYTSGSTSQPKGVMVSHGNLMHNLAIIYQQFGHTAGSHGVIWLPPHHDMGLIGGILQPIYGGFPVTLMPPESFLRQPVRWLQAISYFRATTSGGPNFAYDYCLQKITPKQRRGLDLSSWTLAFVGAETVRAQTLTDFAATFADCGFPATAFYPCYGLAEATLFVSGGEQGRSVNSRNLSRTALGDGQVMAAPAASAAISVVSCGTLVEDAIIVDPQTRQPCAGDQIGEIWVTGASVAQGYWHQPDATRETFRAVLATGQGPYLRTGDLGFRDGASLYVTGRLKDLIVIRGQNHFPQDIEHSMVQSHADLEPQGAAAFSCDLQGQENLVVFQEIRREALRSLDAAAVTSAIRAAISQHHGLQVAAIWLLKPSHLPRTTSGKVQRQACRLAFQRRTLVPVGQWPSGENSTDRGVEAPKKDPSSSAAPTEHQQAEALMQWLRQYANESINSQLMDERRCLSPAVVLDFGNQGLLGMQVPKQYGGLGFSHQAMLRVLEQLGAIDSTLALFVGLNNVLGIRPILQAARPALRDRLLPQLATGRELAAFALTEPGAGANPLGIVSKAVPTVKGWNLHGQKLWSGSAAWAGVINIFVKQYDGSGTPVGISGFAVPKGTPGLRQGPEALTMGMRGMVQNTVFLNQVPVDASQLLGEPGAGMAVAQDAMMYGRLAIAAACVGGMKRCAQLMLRYSSRRTVSTGRLVENSVMLTRLSDLTHAIATLNSLVSLTAQRLDAGLTMPEELYTACKIMGPEFYWQAADDLVQCLGGRGYIETNLAPQILRDARVLRIFEGPTEALAMYLGARVLHQPQTLRHLFAELNLSALATQLFEAADQILSHYLSPQSPFSAAVIARQQANCWVGQIAAWALSIAAVRATTAESVTLAWGQQSFAQRIAQALVTSPSESAGISVTAVSQTINQYQASIGEIEQTLAGCDQTLDAWLQKTPQPPALGLASPPENSGPEAHLPQPLSPDPSQLKQAKTIEQWLSQWLAQRLRLEIADIESTRALADYGVDSVMAVELAQDLEDLLDLPQPLDVTLAWNFPTLATLSRHLAQLSGRAASTIAVDQPAPQAMASTQENIPLAALSADLADLTEAEMAAALAAELTMAGEQ